MKHVSSEEGFFFRELQHLQAIQMDTFNRHVVRCFDSLVSSGLPKEFQFDESAPRKKGQKLKTLRLILVRGDCKFRSATVPVLGRVTEVKTHILR